MFKYKQLILGTVIGLIFIPITAFATINLNIATNPYPVIVDGIETDVDGYNINGSTYLKLKDFEKAGLEVKFNSDNKQIEVSTSAGTASGSQAQDNSEPATNSQITSKPTSTPDGITNIDEWEGKYYIGTSYIDNKCKKTGYSFEFNIKLQKWQLLKDDTVILEDVPITMTYSYGSVEYTYYINNIMPIISTGN